MVRAIILSSGRGHNSYKWLIASEKRTYTNTISEIYNTVLKSIFHKKDLVICSNSIGLSSTVCAHGAYDDFALRERS